MPLKPEAAFLLVDDRADNLLALEATLKPTGYQLVRASSGPEALQRLKEREYALILLDVQMPEMDGFETARLIRAYPAYAAIPIIFITAISEDPVHVFRGYESGAIDYLIKPFDDEILRAKVAVIVELYEKTAQLKRRERELAAANGQLQREIRERKHAELALRLAHDELEIRVRERTAALAASNEALRSEVAERQRTQERLAASLREKEVLLKEVHHRVKNNLQVTSSLLSLQADYIKDPEALRYFAESQSRIRAMALVHEKLYGTDDVACIDMGAYIETLAGELLHAYAEPDQIALAIRTDEVMLGIETAVPCGLILNELISNVAKHAFPAGRSGRISIELRREAHDGVVLTVQDNGVGMPPAFSLESTNSLGLRLVEALVNQLGGTIELDGRAGTTFTIRFVSMSPKMASWYADQIVNDRLPAPS